MMGGRTNVWESGKNVEMGLSDKQGKRLPKGFLKHKDNSSHDDDHLELNIISSAMNLALGKAHRLAQEKGPFIIKFKSPTPRQPRLVTYMQMDGEFYKVQNADRIEIKLNPSFPRLKVLICVD